MLAILFSGAFLPCQGFSQVFYGSFGSSATYSHRETISVQVVLADAGFSGEGTIAEFNRRQLPAPFAPPPSPLICSDLLDYSVFCMPDVNPLHPVGSESSYFFPPFQSSGYAIEDPPNSFDHDYNDLLFYLPATEGPEMDSEWIAQRYANLQRDTSLYETLIQSGIISDAGTVPEPSTGFLLLLAAGCLGLRRRRWRLDSGRPGVRHKWH